VEYVYQGACVDPSDPYVLRYSINYMRDMRGTCPIDLCMTASQNKTTNVLLKYLAGQGIDHHSRILAKHMPAMLDMGLSNFVSYFESRGKQTSQLMKYSRREIDEDRATPGISAAETWTTDAVLESMFTKSEKGEDIKVWFMDVSGLPEFGDVAQKFFSVMAETDEMDLFKLDIVRSLILFKWPRVKDKITKRLFYPFLVLLLFTWIYTTYILPARLRVHTKAGVWWLYERLVEEVVLILSLYFVSLESSQMREDGLEYFASIWNIIDIGPCIILPGLVVANLFGAFDNVATDEEGGHLEALSVSASAATLLLWLRFLYFLRIFEATGAYIRAIVEVIKDMKFFLLILMITMMSFGDSFKVMSLANIGLETRAELSNQNDEDASQFIEGGFFGSLFYAYLIGLGEFNLDDFGAVGVLYCQLLFVVNTVITTIIMLNLLIAIISDSFETVNSQGSLAAYKEKAGLIAENQFLIGKDDRRAYSQKGKLLLYVERLNQIGEDEDNADFEMKQLIKEQFTKIEGKLEDGNLGLRNRLKTIEDTVKRLDANEAEDDKEDLDGESFDPTASLEPLRPIGLHLGMLGIIASDGEVAHNNGVAAAVQKRASRLPGVGGILDAGVGLG